MSMCLTVSIITAKSRETYVEAQSVYTSIVIWTFIITLTSNWNWWRSRNWWRLNYWRLSRSWWLFRGKRRRSNRRWTCHRSDWLFHRRRNTFCYWYRRRRLVNRKSLTLDLWITCCSRRTYTNRSVITCLTVCILATYS